MKIKIACIFILGLCIMGYHSSIEVTPTVKALNMSQKQTIISQSHLKVINAVSTVKRGETGVITIQGKPNTKYNIKTSYKVGNRTISVIQWRTTDGIGVATFNWIVSMDTIAGTYAATIAGGDEVLNTKHTVLQ